MPNKQYDFIIIFGYLIAVFCFMWGFGTAYGANPNDFAYDGTGHTISTRYISAFVSSSVSTPTSTDGYFARDVVGTDFGAGTLTVIGFNASGTRIFGSAVYAGGVNIATTSITDLFFNGTKNAVPVYGIIGASWGSSCAGLTSAECVDYIQANVGITIGNVQGINIPPSTSTLPVINFAFPTGTTTTPDFYNWVLDVQGLTTEVARIGVRYSRIQTTSTTFTDETSFSFVSSNPFPLHKSLTGLNGSYVAQAYLKDAGGNFISETILKYFSISPTSTLPTASTSTILAGPFGFNSANYIASSTSACNGEFWCSALQFLFSPTNLTQDWINGGVNGAKSVFPFRVVFQTIDTINAEINSSSTTLAERDYDMIVHFRVANQDFTIPLLTSSTLESAVGSSTKATLFELQTNGLYLLLLFGIIKIIL